VTVGNDFLAKVKRELNMGLFEGCKKETSAVAGSSVCHTLAHSPYTYVHKPVCIMATAILA
jgi:hypothetical protein